jgi:hypothetical protein
LVVGVLGSEAAEGEGDGGAREDGTARDDALLVDGFDIFVAAEERVPLKAFACFSR